MAVDWTRWDSDPTWSSQGFDFRPPWIFPNRPTSLRWAMARTIEPTDEPVSLEEARLHLRVDTSDDDSLILDIISTARDWAETNYGISFLTQSWILALDRWPSMTHVEKWPWTGTPLGSILIPRTPIQSVTNLIWYDSTGGAHVVDPATYEFDFIRTPARVVSKSNASWPSNDLSMLNGVRLTVVGGYASKAVVPRRFKQALLLLIGHWYQNREAYVIDSTRMTKIETPLAAHDLLSTALPPMVG